MSSACWKHASAVAVSSACRWACLAGLRQEEFPPQAVHFCRPEADEIRLRQLHGLLDHGQALLDLTTLEVGLGQEGQKKGDRGRTAEAAIPRQTRGEQGQATFQLASCTHTLPWNIMPIVS